MNEKHEAIHDEGKRRENENIWLATYPLNQEIDMDGLEETEDLYYDPFDITIIADMLLDMDCEIADECIRNPYKDPISIACAIGQNRSKEAGMLFRDCLHILGEDKFRAVCCQAFFHIQHIYYCVREEVEPYQHLCNAFKDACQNMQKVGKA